MSAVPREARDPAAEPPPAAPDVDHPGRGLPRTRAGTAWVLACVAAVALLALIVFITQNLHLVEVSFLGWHGRFPVVVALLAGMLIGAVLTLILGSTRILQLRRTAASSRRRVPSNIPSERTP